MNRMIILVLVALLMGTDFCHRDTESTEVEIVIVKAPGKEPRNPYQDEYERMLYPTVRISSPAGTGSGVVINHKAHKEHKENTKEYIYILSAAHVVEDENSVSIEFYSKDIRIDAEVVLTDTTKDIALLRVLCDLCGEGIYSASLAPESYSAYLFTPIYTVGCSLGLKPRPSQGIITQIPPSPFVKGGDEGDFPYWEISAPVLPGNSGGPVFDSRTYEVIGIAVWVKVYDGQLITTMAGIVPINQIHEFLNETTNELEETTK